MFFKMDLRIGKLHTTLFGSGSITIPKNWLDENFKDVKPKFTKLTDNGNKTITVEFLNEKPVDVQRPQCECENPEPTENGA